MTLDSDTKNRNNEALAGTNSCRNKTTCKTVKNETPVIPRRFETCGTWPLHRVTYFYYAKGGKVLQGPSSPQKSNFPPRIKRSPPPTSPKNGHHVDVQSDVQFAAQN